tara:strand:- start:767 stop:994 length:228 start_codon:yes stop_codon:yes gene_type:complete
MHLKKTSQQILGDSMTNNEFQELLSMLRRLMRIVDEFEAPEFEKNQPKAMMIPPEIYDEICDSLKQKNITLFGVS